MSSSAKDAAIALVAFLDLLLVTTGFLESLEVAVVEFVVVQPFISIEDTGEGLWNRFSKLSIRRVIVIIEADELISGEGLATDALVRGAVSIVVVGV